METKMRLLSNDASCSIYALSVTDEKAMNDVAAAAAAAVGTWNVLILNASFLVRPCLRLLRRWWRIGGRASRFVFCVKQNLHSRLEHSSTSTKREE